MGLLPSQEAELHASAVIGAANEVHNVLGPGYKKPVYREAFRDELASRGVPFLLNPVLSVCYKGRVVGEEKLDFLVGHDVLIDVFDDEYEPMQAFKMRSRLVATKMCMGMLINFNVPEMVFGIRRIWPKAA
ncbi:MAG: GxxExxY protein [Sumerlaeia bacterium]